MKIINFISNVEEEKQFEEDFKTFMKEKKYEGKYKIYGEAWGLVNEIEAEWRLENIFKESEEYWGDNLAEEYFNEIVCNIDVWDYVNVDAYDDEILRCIDNVNIKYGDLDTKIAGKIDELEEKVSSGAELEIDYDKTKNVWYAMNYYPDRGEAIHMTDENGNNVIAFEKYDDNDNIYNILMTYNVMVVY